jgi:hypothetical protein
MSCVVPYTTNMMIPKSSKRDTSMRLLLVALLSLFPTCAADGSDEWQLWRGLVQLLLASFFVLLGLHFMLYSHLSTYSLMKEYQTKGVTHMGDVLSCDVDPSYNNAQWEIDVLYTASVNQYATRSSSRLEFRHPEKIQYKRYGRRFPSDRAMARGTPVELWLLPGFPKSGLTRDFVQAKLAAHSHFRTILYLVPGLLLLALIIGMQVVQVQGYDDKDDGKRLGWIVMGAVWTAIFFVAGIWSDARWQAERRIKYNSAVAMTTKYPTAAAERSDPLLI